jgi:hypothetical protein
MGAVFIGPGVAGRSVPCDEAATIASLSDFGSIQAITKTASIDRDWFTARIPSKPAEQAEILCEAHFIAGVECT